MEKRKLIKLILELLGRLARALSSRGHQPGGAFLSLRGTSRKTKLIEIHENFIRNSEASVKPGIVPHIKQFSLVFFSRRRHTRGRRVSTGYSLYSSYTRGQLWEKFANVTNVNLRASLTIWLTCSKYIISTRPFKFTNRLLRLLSPVFPHFSLSSRQTSFIPLDPTPSIACNFFRFFASLPLPYIYIYSSSSLHSRNVTTLSSVTFVFHPRIHGTRTSSIIIKERRKSLNESWRGEKRSSMRTRDLSSRIYIYIYIRDLEKYRGRTGKGRREMEREKGREKERERVGMVGARGGWAPNWKRFSVGEGRHQSERSVSKETWRRALVWRGPQAPMGLLGKGAGAQRRYTIERRYQRFLDSPWPTPQLNIFTRAGPSPSMYRTVHRVHTWLLCTPCASRDQPRTALLAYADSILRLY